MWKSNNYFIGLNQQIELFKKIILLLIFIVILTLQFNEVIEISLLNVLQLII